MQTQAKKTATKTAPKRKPAPKSDVKAAPAIIGKAEHIAAGIPAGILRDVTPAIPTGIAKYQIANGGALPPTSNELFAAIRKAYKPSDKFPARGLDNAKLARLLSAGYLARVSGTGREYTDKNGAARIGDATDNQLMLQFGKATIAPVKQAKA